VEFCRGGLGKKMGLPEKGVKTAAPVYDSRKEESESYYDQIVRREPGGTEVLSVNLDRSRQKYPSMPVHLNFFE